MALFTRIWHVNNMQENKCTVAQNLTQRLDKMAIDNFGHTFTYGKVFYADLDDEPATVEELYINNDGECGTTVDEEMSEIYKKAQALTHFSYFITKKKSCYSTSKVLGITCMIQR